MTLRTRGLIKWLFGGLFLAILIFGVYLSQLNSLVKNEFSKPNQANSIDYIHEFKPLTNMLLLVEDQSFFKHSGVDFREIMRVLRDYFLHDKSLRGASTITQQLIKNSLLTRHRTFNRKFKEILMALLLEASIDKKTILNRYMNDVYLGQKGARSINGFANAAAFYFDKNIAFLSLEESATLVALVKGPSYYHPVKYPERLAKRKNLVLRVFHQHQKIVK
jgi:penicillin-binding protein 1B